MAATATAGQPTSRYLTVGEAAGTARVCSKTVRRWVKQGLLPAFRAGSVVRIDGLALERLLAGTRHQ